MYSDVPYFIITRQLFNGSWYSTLKHMILAGIIYIYKKGSLMRQFLEKLRLNSFLANNDKSEFEIIYNVTRNIPVSLKDYSNLSSIQKFGLVSITDDVDFFVGLMKKYTDCYVISSSEYVC